MTDDELITLAEAASVSGVEVRTLSRWVEDGRLPFVTTPGGHRRLFRGDVEAILVAGGPRRARAPRRQDRKTEFVSASLTRPARDELRRFAADIVPHAGRAVSLSEALIAVLRVADDNREAVVHELTRDTT